MDVQAAQAFIFEKMARNLSPTLFYHGLHHTHDVLSVALALAAAEGITDPEALALLHTAACFHDCGFITTYKGHEEEGCRLAGLLLPAFGYKPDQIETVCGLIKATEIPQNAQTPLEKILCDADLDYLGRDDFEPIARTLYDELRQRELVPDEPTWNSIQVNFLTAHRYHTATAKATRHPRLLEHLAALRTLVTE